jgi:hypothetical protein
MAGIDIVELQGSGQRHAAVLELPIVVEETTDAPPAFDGAAPGVELGALIDEIAALRTDLEAARRRDLWVVLGAIAAAVVVLALLIRA